MSIIEHTQVIGKYAIIIIMWYIDYAEHNSVSTDLYCFYGKGLFFYPVGLSAEKYRT